MIMIRSNLGFGFFFTKQDLDYTNKHIAIGIRLIWKANQFCDIYIYPRMLCQNRTW